MNLQFANGRGGVARRAGWVGAKHDFQQPFMFSGFCTFVQFAQIVHFRIVKNDIFVCKKREQIAPILHVFFDISAY